MDRFRSGPLTFGRGRASVTIGPEMGALINATLDRIAPTTKRRLTEVTKEVAADAADKWYQQVDRGTDDKRSGDEITQGLRLPSAAVLEGFVTNVDPHVKYIHRPGPNSTLTEKASKLEYGRRRRAGMPWREALYIRKPNPKASDGKYLLQELIIKPGKLRAKELAADIAHEIATGKRS